MSEEKDISQEPKAGVGTQSNEAPLAAADVIPEAGKDIFNEYLSLSITSDGHDTTLSAITIQGEPMVYTTIFHDITANDFQTLLSQIGLDTDLG